jgi:alginate O-acetyltransferase complex protein AlgI
MVFSSTIFLYGFLPIVLLFYFLSPGTWAKNMVLLVFSFLFYAWGEPKFIFLMIVSVLINYIFGLLVYKQKLNGKKGTGFLACAVILNLGLLFYFKYYHFAATSIVNLLNWEVTIPEIALPIGISFYTFQGMSYVIDVYREKLENHESSLVQKDILKLALYISLFPQLIAGPIVRYIDIYPRLTKRFHSVEQFAAGAEVFIIGLSKKVILANMLGAVADSIIEANVGIISPAQAWLGAAFYMLQIYYDFCGYSEMAIGLGRIFGFDFMKNFDYPYISTSITEFWKRWHISLSSWFRDYLYIPLGGNRKGNVYVNLSIVFLATGIWHGADWSFILWGVWHGLFMLIERYLKKNPMSIPLPKAVKQALGWIYTMLVVLLGWVVFRIANIPKAVKFIKLMFGMSVPEFVGFDIGWYLNSRTALIFAIAIICCIPWKRILEKRFEGFAAALEHPLCIFAKRVVLLALMAICFLLVTNSTYNPFIYFRF